MSRFSRRQALVAPLALLAPTCFGGGRAQAAPRELRLKAPQGVVRVYRPPHYDAAKAGLAIYVHGLYTDVDHAWAEHQLPEQFAASRRNALFIVPAARSEATAMPPWDDLQTLLDLIARELPSDLLPDATAPLVIAGHSGAYKQIVQWLSDVRLHTLLFLDALYGGEVELRAWLDAATENRMALVNHDTVPAAHTFIQDIPYALYRKRCPTQLTSLTPAEREAKLLSMDTHTDHFGIVTNGTVLPMLLRWSALPARG
ncbi:MAG: hypothetical protein QOI66_3395 [Myxococcales bacterium]|nr:hypothetical protein [Myxococcales bacterium]